MFKFCLKYKKDLIKNFEDNLISKKKSCKKPHKFFDWMSKEVITKNKIQCKAKFKKIEEFIYTKILKISNEKY